MNKYEIISKVGEGAYGVVLKCKHKVRPPATTARPAQQQQAAAEAHADSDRKRERGSDAEGARDSILDEDDMCMQMVSSVTRVRSAHSLTVVSRPTVDVRN
jgi:hypothetical protein